MSGSFNAACSLGTAYLPTWTPQWGPMSFAPLAANSRKNRGNMANHSQDATVSLRGGVSASLSLNTKYEPREIFQDINDLNLFSMTMFMCTFKFAYDINGEHKYRTLRILK